MRNLLTDTDIQNALQLLNSEATQRWRMQENALLADWVFADFLQAMAFMQEVAGVAHRLDHHPEWSNVYNRVSVRLTTHDRGGVTPFDVELAQAMNRISLAWASHG
ncbi:MAG: 4a-hydroxytetrahydrobiopterin dehydratase [Limnohabitans sp.]